MYAVVDTWSMDLEALPADHQNELNEQIVPMIRQQPGYISGYWTYDRANKKSHGFHLLESEEAARGLKAFVEQDAGRGAEIGIHLTELVIAEVMAEARAGVSA